MTREEKKLYLLRNINALLQKKPFFRGSDIPSVNDYSEGQTATVTETRTARIPKVRKTIVTQERFLKELDPMSHEVLFDQNLPSICVKLENGGYQEIKFQRTALAFQEQILASHVIYLCGNPCVLSLRGSNPSDKDKINYSTIKEYWVDRNMDGWRTKAVRTQLATGDAGLLFYYDYKGRIKCRLISYEDGYVIISHNDNNGDRLLESVYYADENGVEYIDSYDDRYMYRMRNSGDGADDDGWVREAPVEHGFSEIPLCTKRGDVAWNNGQSLIEIYEIIYNIFFVIQKRNGWGILYIKGNLSETTKKIAGNIILQDKSMDANGSAEFKSPPSPDGMLSSLEDLFEKIQINTSCTFLLPKDVKSSGDISGLAITLTRDLDLKNAQQGVIEWQNFADKMMRLFKEGLAKELVKNGDNANAVTEFARLRVSCKFKIWQPFSATEYNNMLISMKQAGILSTKTAVEKNTESVPDEEQRMAKEKEEAQKQLEKQQGTNKEVTEQIDIIEE